MSSTLTAVAAMTLSEVTQKRFAQEVAKYPADQSQSAVMACLSIVQQEKGWVSPEAELAVAEYLGMPAMAVREVSSFYNMYNLKPVGRYRSYAARASAARVASPMASSACMRMYHD